MSSPKCIVPNQKSLVCQVGNQEECIERDVLFCPDYKVVIKGLPAKNKKNVNENKTILDRNDYTSSMESLVDGEDSCASSGRNSPVLKEPPAMNPIKDAEESGASSGYESGYVTPNKPLKKKRKLSKRKELLSAAILTSHLERLEESSHVGIHKSHIKYAEVQKNASSFEASETESTEPDSTSSDEESVSTDQKDDCDAQMEKAFEEEEGTEISELSDEISIVELRDPCPSEESWRFESRAPLCQNIETLYDSRRPNTSNGIAAENMLLKIDLTDTEKLKKCAIEKEKVGENSAPVPEHKPLKTGKQRFRWNLLFNVLVWLIIPLPVWLPFVDQTVAMYLIPSLQGLFVLMWTVIVSLAARNMIILYRHRNYDFKAEYPEYIDLRHLVAISCYKEPVALIARSVQSLADQTEAKRVTMVISFEEKTPDVEKKIEELTAMFGNSFERLLFTVHPFGQPNEIPGKCSNANYGLRESVGVLQQEMGLFFDPTKIIVTTCDADSNFHPKYIEALTSRFLKEKNPHAVVFQAPLLYNWGLDGASFVTRVTGLLRSTLMMGALIPFNINTMSIFSFSLKLCMNGNFVHPGYQMDDIICLIRWMGVTRQRLRIPMIPVPVISGPTAGNTIELELSEWARQARRWTIGAGEVFHYYVIKAKGIPFLPAFSWGLCFLIYYGILLCSAGLYGVSASISMALLVANVPVYMTYTMYGLAGLQMLCFLVMFILDVVGPRLMNIEEHISFIRNALHWLLTPFVLIGYSLVELYALHEVMIRGKEVCKHGASKKSALQAA